MSQMARIAAFFEKVKNLRVKDRCLIVRKNAVKVEISTSPPHAVLCDHAQSGCEVCSQTSAQKAAQKELRLVVAHDLLDTINAELDSMQLLAILENENTIERNPFSE
ncbi:hypothetical protein TNCV_2605811 [Trichonephila clavipes]|nr:hypothetical protein TNCV_2605811 [Trichonephila clavipes]